MISFQMISHDFDRLVTEQQEPTLAMARNPVNEANFFRPYRFGLSSAAPVQAELQFAF